MIIYGFLYFGLSFLLFSFTSWHYFLSDRKFSIRKIFFAFLGGFLSSNIVPAVITIGISSFCRRFEPHTSMILVYFHIILTLCIVYPLSIRAYAALIQIKHKILVLILYSHLTLVSNITNIMFPHMDEPMYILLSIALNFFCVACWYIGTHKDFDVLMQSLGNMKKTNIRVFSIILYLLTMLTYMFGIGITMYRAVHQLTTWDGLQIGVTFVSVFSLLIVFSFAKIMLCQANGSIRIRQLYKSTIESNQQSLLVQSQMINLQEDVIEAFADILENKSSENGGHVRRVAIYSEILAKELGLSAEIASTIRIASMMHDIGKILIPNEILEKNGNLSDEEYDIMKRHVLYGDHILKTSRVKILATARNIAREHHERWDGKGYMLGLKGDEISIEAQIVAVADVFDALTSRRSYKHAWDIRDAISEILKGKGTQFSPRVVDAFLRSAISFRKIYMNIPEEEKRATPKTLVQRRSEALDDFCSGNSVLCKETDLSAEAQSHDNAVDI